jgi:hypothetical protein
LHDAIRLLIVFIIQQLAQDRRDDLPPHPELVFEPAAPLCFPAGRELLPKGNLIYFLLYLAPDEERNGVPGKGGQPFTYDLSIVE